MMAIEIFRAVYMGWTIGQWGILWAFLVTALWIIRRIAISRAPFASVHSRAFFSVEVLLVTMLVLGSLASFGCAIGVTFVGAFGGLFLHPAQYLVSILMMVTIGWVVGAFALRFVRSSGFTAERRKYSPGMKVNCPYCLVAHVYEHSLERCRSCDRVLFK
jgi:hypothetical protein